MTHSASPSGLDAGSVGTGFEGGGTIARIRFGHPKGNSLPAALLGRLAEAIREAGRTESARVILLQSEGLGGGPFCAGASLTELQAIRDEAGGQRFFSGFAEVILAMIRAPQLVVTRVQGKTAGGGVGIVAASDYAIATAGAAVRLSELALGLGPFVVGPVIEKKIGLGAFAALAVEAGWRSAAWAERHGLYAEVIDDGGGLDERVMAVAARLASYSPAAARQLKAVLWEGTEDWPELLTARAGISGKLALTDASRRAVAG